MYTTFISTPPLNQKKKKKTERQRSTDKKTLANAHEEWKKTHTKNNQKSTKISLEWCVVQF